MTRKRKELPVAHNLLITDVAAEGKAIARYDDRIIFIPFVIPGDVVDVQIRRKRKNFAEGKVIQLVTSSPDRVKPVCDYFGICGGCKWQMLPYKDQLRYKEKQVVDNLTRIGKVELPTITPILGANETIEYRNKLEFTFSNKRWLTEEQIQTGETFDNMNGLGFHIPGAFDKVLDIDKCWLQIDISNQIRNFIREYCFSNSYTFFDLRNKGGLMRTLLVRTSSTGELMVIVVFYENDKKAIKDIMQAVQKEFPAITSLLYVINEKANDTIADQEILVWSGEDHMWEEMEGLRFKIGPKSFYQTNSEQAYQLYQIARNFAGLTGNELVYDLYTGTGTIANFVAKQAKQVIGIEYVEDAIKDAKVNAEINGLTNTLFFAGDMKDILTTDFIAEYGKPDVIITDPPRAGMHQDVIDTILAASPSKIVYVSCNPATQARDLSLLDVQYKVTKVQPVDMFPHTHHVENVVLLEKR